MKAIRACDFEELLFRAAVRTCAVAAEGLHFLWSHRNASLAYVRWRLGTLYGSFSPDGGDRPLSELLACLWRDRRQAAAFLLWRRGTRARMSS